MKINKEGFEKATKKTYLEYLRLFPVLKRERAKKYGMLIFTFATMTFFGIFAINPTLTTIVELQRKLKDATFVEQQLAKKINNLSLLQNQYQLITPDLGVIQAAIPQTAEATRFMGQLQALVAQSGVTLSGITLGELTLSTPSPASQGEFTFTIQIEGTFQQVDAFLKSLTSFERIVVLDSLTIVKQTAGNPTMSLTIEGTAHYKQ